MGPGYTNPRDYLLSGGYTSLIVHGFPLSDLERAIVGYVESSTFETKRRGTFEKTASYDALRELIFEYYKIINPAVIKNFLASNRSDMEGLNLEDWTPQRRIHANTWVTHFRNLGKRKNIDRVTYQQFEPGEYRSIRTITKLGPTAFSKYSLNILENLITLGIFIRQGGARQSYVSLNPDLGFSKPAV